MRIVRHGSVLSVSAHSLHKHSSRRVQSCLSISPLTSRRLAQFQLRISLTRLRHEGSDDFVFASICCCSWIACWSWRELAGIDSRLHHMLCCWLVMPRCDFFLQDLARPDAPDKIIANSEPLDEYQRKTQSPLIWCSIHNKYTPRACV